MTKVAAVALVRSGRAADLPRKAIPSYQTVRRF
ncbi:predicted protein [Sclerotinia sclerotiorum 1980 UF-70]|uniref:Uncharacterized protein n=1 Tax=Sclerotinia sclerotiorum (strain ATCC 18683 / 1980 / Ss-1) TaxID=665079 RepID=A7ED56_SCLS1|nr:predicted protein [Sclerotinia sclerotiorum 1980 UF-70]EDO00772.1 predicted protein [Sclerotinia sclerotiorum 1980 UF-70]